MSPDQEAYLWEHIHDSDNWSQDTLPRYVIQRMLADGMIQSAKQAWATLQRVFSALGARLEYQLESGELPSADLVQQFDMLGRDL